MRPVLHVELTEDLSTFTRFLWANEVPHRVTEDNTGQTLWVTERVSVERISELYSYWREGGDLDRISVQQSHQAKVFSLSELRLFPFTLLLLSLSVIATLAINFGANTDWLSRLSFSPFDIKANQVFYSDVSELLAAGEFWRLITPIFLHFSLLHILFNLLWIWVIGRHIERLHGAIVFLSLVGISGISSNFAQYFVSGPLFGGMSGVVFGVLGYAWLFDRLAGPCFRIPPALMGFMLFWLALGFSGALEFMGLGAIANTAHLVGLLAGLFCALIVNKVRS